jgi:hypothetical protein
MVDVSSSLTINRPVEVVADSAPKALLERWT